MSEVWSNQRSIFTVIGTLDLLSPSIYQCLCNLQSSDDAPYFH